jgi:hypothetical protein
MGTAVSEEPTAALATFSLFCFGKEVGNVFPGPLSASLISPVTVIGSYSVTKYSRRFYLLVHVCCAALSA